MLNYKTSHGKVSVGQKKKNYKKNSQPINPRNKQSV